MSDGFAIKLPLTVGADNIGYDKIDNYKDYVKQNLKMLLLTTPGERIMDPNFGVGMRNFLFEPNTTATAGAIISKINQQAGLYLSYLDITDIKVSHERDYLSISIQYRIIPTGIYDELTTISQHGINDGR